MPIEGGCVLLVGLLTLVLSLCIVSSILPVLMATVASIRRSILSKG